METNSNNNEYIDIDDALSRVGGNMALYKRLLGKFLDGNHFDGLERALSGGDTEEASRQTHSLKGISANLSLKKIHELSVELEHLLKTGADCSVCTNELKKAFTATTEKIEEIRN